MFVRCVGVIVKNCIDFFEEYEISGLDIGKVLGYGLLYGLDESYKKFVKDVLFIVLCIVVEKKGIKRIFDIFFSDNLIIDYV